MDFNWLWVVPVLGVLIIVHEMGHFFAARWLGIGVEEFGIGFPPRVFAIRRGGIDYSLNLLPIGGFVKIVGENGDSDAPNAFGKAAAWKRIIVLAAGSAMNLLLALIIFMGMSIAGTREFDAPQTGIGTVLPDQPAEVGGLRPGDRILSVAGQPVSTSDEILLNRENQGKPIVFEVERDGRTVPLTITPNVDPANGAYLGVTLAYWVVPARIDQVAPGSAAAEAGLQSGDIIREVNGEPVENLPEAQHLLTSSEAAAVLIVERGGERVEPITLPAAKDRRQSGITLFIPTRMVYYNPGEALGKALNNTWAVLASIPQGIGQAIAGQAEGPGVTGPVGIGQLTGEVAQGAGLNGLLQLTALLGISLFMINLMPLPALDGGRLLFIFIELLRGGRRIAPEKEGMVHFAGMMVLLALLALITVFDVGRLIEGKGLLNP